MTFFRQLQLLLWKNGLGIIRRPFWSVTLILWPVIIFVIIAVTRYQFPPVLRDTCYVGPRNLPSTGFFPFLETLMCNTDSNCQNTSRQLYPASAKQPLRTRRSTQLSEDSPLSKLIKGQELIKFVNSENSSHDPALLLDALYNIFGSSRTQTMNASNANMAESQPISNLTESAAVLKNVVCTLSLPMVNTSSPDPFITSMVTFCKSNNTVFEVAINTLNNILLGLMTSNPEDIAKLAEKVVMLFDQLQNEASLWESFLSLPQIFSPESPDQMLSSIETLLSNLQVVLNITEKNFPEIKANMSVVHPFIVGGISLTQYIQNWPGKDVSIRLGDVVLENNTLWEMVKNIEIPLDKAIALTWDRNMVRGYVCNNSTNPMLVAACTTGTLDMFLGWICPNKLAMQTLLAWSKYVAPHDLAFAKGLLHSLGGFFGLQGGPASTMTDRSMETQPQNIEEELFLEVGKVVMEVLQISPEAHVLVQHVLRTGFQSMKTATQALDSVQGMIDNVLKDATKLKMIYQTLMTNQSQSSIWINETLDSISDILLKSLASEPLSCESVLGPFQWLFSTESIKLEVWQSIICQNSSTVEEALLNDWLPLTQNVQELYNTLQGNGDYNITLPMILSEWHKLFNKSQHFGVFLERLVEELGGAYWINWSGSSTDHLTTSLQQSVPLFMVNLGQKFEMSHLWPEAKNYFLIANWILNYKAGVTAEPNCSMNMNNLAIECDTPFNWQQFVDAMAQALMSQSQEVLVSCLKGSVNLLQHVYSDFYKYEAASFLNKAIQDGDMLSAFLINLMNQLNDFTQTLTTLPDKSISNPQIMVPLYQKLLESTGLTPLLPLILSDGTPNISQVLEVASKLGRSNQDIFTFNESDPTLPELEQYIMQFLSMEGNLTMSLYLSMGHTLLTYSSYFRPEYVDKLREAIQPFTNQTSAGIVEAILRAVELLKTIMDSPHGDPTHIILGYIRQLQEFLVSLFHMQRIEQFTLPNGQLSLAQVTDIQLFSDIVHLLTPETLLNLTEVGPDAAQDIIVQKYIESLPPEIRPEATEFLKKFAALQNHIGQCETGQNCLEGISEMFTFLDQILKMVLNTNGNVTINIAATNTYLGRKEYEPVAYTFFSLILHPDDAAYVKTVQDTLEFIRLLMSQPNISVSHVQEALKQTNLTIEELNYIVTQLGATNLNDLIEKIIKLIDSQQCFEQEASPVLTAHCAVGLVNGVSGFLSQLPSLQSETSILSLIPLIVNKTVSDMIRTNFSDNPQKAVAEVMNATLDNIKMTLHLNNLSTPEIMNEIKVLENLIKLAADPRPLKYLIVPPNPFDALEAPLEIINWYLQRLENVTSGSSISDLLYPLFRITQLQVSVQLAQLELNRFIAESIGNLTHSLQYPIDADGVSKIGQTTMEILHQMLKFIIVNLEAQNVPSYAFGYEPPINMTVVNATLLQLNYNINLIQQWVTQTNVSGVLSSIMTWGNTSNNISTPVNDIYHLLQTTFQFFSDDQLNYIYAISNITQSLNKALMLAEQPDGLQSDHFLVAIMEAAQNAMHVLTRETGPLPPSVQQNLLEVVKSIIQLTVQPEMSYSQSLNTTLHILKNLQLLVEQTVSEDVAQYLVAGLQVATTYFQSVSTAMGPDNWNQMILNQMKTVQSLLHPNSTAQPYITALINISHYILEPVQGNMSLWAVFEQASKENVPQIFVQMGKLLNIIWPLFMGGTGSPPTESSLKSFADLPLVLEQVMTGKANNDTWLNLQTMLKIMLSTIKDTELLHNLSCVVELIEKGLGNEVNMLKAENDFIVGLQVPVMTLIMEITRSLNGSHFNISEVSERLEAAIENTLMTSQQASGTLDCHEALKAWEPVREAAGLAQSSMAKWCNISLGPVIEASFNAVTHQNLSCTDMGPVSLNAAAARIVRSVQSLYHTEMTQSLVTDQFIQAFYNQLSVLTDQPLSHEAELNLYKQLQDMQLQSSLSSIRVLSEELKNLSPFLNPYTDALEKSLVHILKNYHQIQDSGSSQEFFSEAAMILLYSLNFTSDDIYYIMSGNFSNEAWIDMVTKGLKMMVDMKIFGDDPMLYQTLEQLLGSNNTRMIVENVTEMFSWFMSAQASEPDLLIQSLAKIHELLSHFLSALTQMNIYLPPSIQLLEDLTGNMISFIQHLLTTGGFATNSHFNMYEQQMSGYNNTRVRRRREAPLMPVGGPMDDFMDLLSINYHSMFQALMVPPTPEEILETVHVFFANPDLGIVMKGATKDMLWGLESSREDTIDAALGVASLLTIPGIDLSSVHLWINAVNMLPDGFPYSLRLKNITYAITKESQENLMLMQETLQTVTTLFQTSLTDPQFTELLGQLENQVCSLENTDPVHLLMQNLSLEQGLLCNSIVPSLKILAQSFLGNTSTLLNNIFDVFIGEPRLYNVQTNWTSVFTEGLGLNFSSLSALNITSTAPRAVTIGEMVRNKTAFLLDMQQHTSFEPAVVYLLTETALPNNNLQILSWLVNMRHCDSTDSTNMAEAEMAIFKSLCSMSPEQWYSFSLMLARHLNMEKFIYRMVLPEEIQSLVQTMLHMAEAVVNMMKDMVPAIRQLQEYLISIEDFNLAANNEFRQMSRAQRPTISSGATFVTISRALCSQGILSLFGIAKNPKIAVSAPTFTDRSQREEMIERFKIPRNATPFCTNMYLDMVNTTGGAIAWAFLKPMLMGQILFTPDTPMTRDIMNKANSTLQEFADLRHYSQDWIKSSNYIMKSSEILSQTLPMLRNSLGNAFVKNFIEMQTDINVDTMQETLSNFSNMTLLLEKNKDVLNQITTLSTLMVDLSSCIKFDRYQGYDTEEELNTAAEELAKNRNLYASVIFKLPKDRKRNARASSTSTLPPKVSYTIRMHMDNVMRTDRVREPFFVKDSHILARQTLRYNRGFVYLQETIDRAIIEIQTNQKITDPAVQLQPFPYPCYHRDEYLEAISFVFPLLLMIAWVLFVADFVKKLVHEREMRLHEYMKMMGVNPLSHFFAWFIESAAYLVLTIFFLTLVLKYGHILPHSDGFLLFLYMCDYGLSILAFTYLVSSFFDKTYIAALSGSLLYVLFFFPFIVVMAMETQFNFSQKSLLSLFSPTCFSYASQYVTRYETQGEGIQWSNSYSSPIAGDTASFGWLCWLMLIDSILYFIIGAYIRMVFPGKTGIPAPWYFPFKASFWADLCCCKRSKSNSRGLFFSNIMQTEQPVFSDNKGKGKNTLSSKAGEDLSGLPVGVALHGLTKIYGKQVAIENLNVSFHEGHVTSLLGHNGAGKTTTMSLLTGLFPPSSGSIEVYGKDMQAHINDIRKDLGVCMQYDVLFDHMTTKEHLLLYGQIKAPHWTQRQLREQVRSILEETGMYAHRHKRVGTLSGGMKRKLSISIAFIGGSRLVVLDEPTTGVDPCSRRSIWDIVIQHKKGRTIIMSTHHLDEAEVLSDRIAFLERGGLKCCGSPFHLKDQLGQGYKLTLTKKNGESKEIDNAELKSFVQAHIPEARLKEVQGSDLVYFLPPFSSTNASSYRSLLSALDTNLDALQLGCYGISDTTLEEVFLHLTHGNADSVGDGGPLSISETVSDTVSIDSYPSDSDGSISGLGDKICFTGFPTVSGVKLAWQQMTALLIKRFHHSRRDWKGLISQILLPVLFVVFAMGLGTIRSDLRHYPELELSPALYNIGPSYSFFSNPNSSKLADTMLSFPGLDNACLEKSNNQVCTRSTSIWTLSGNSSSTFSTCKCVREKQVCDARDYIPPHKKISSSQIVYNLTGLNVENYLVATADEYIRNRYGGFDFGWPLPPNLQMDVKSVPKNRTLSKVWFNPEGHHTMPAYLSSLNNFILRSNLPADKDPSEYAISVSSHPYFGRPDDEDSVVQGMLQILVAMCVLAGYSITTSSFAIYEVNEHHSGSKRLQLIAGVSEPFYWAVNFFYDMVIYLIPVALTVGVIAAFQIPAFTERQNLGAVTLLLVLFGFATFPWMYLLSSVFKDGEMAFITYVCINLFICVNTIIPTSVLYFMGQITQRNAEALQLIFDRLSYAFLIFPQFNFGNGLLELARMNIEVQILSGYGIDAYKNPFSTDALGWMFISSFIQGVVFFSLRLLLNKFIIRKFRRLILRRRTVPPLVCEDEDEDVAAEHLRVSSGAASSDVLQVNQLTKVYQHLKKKVHAVKRLSLGVPAGECFGLLGVNGAGKTTTFKMLTGDVSPTDGTAQIRDRDGRLVDIMECRNQGINIGYCPQVDALDDLLTGEEHLYFYARLHGISKREIPGVVNYLLRRLELDYYRNTITDGYSCGTRRKLSTALALIGHPQILLLDEPSSGMDPHTKRHLWKIISQEVKGKCAVVLTSHSMEECEALCGRLAIMVKGQFRCLGSLQHIKNRFGSGFTVKMYLAKASSDAEAITSFMQSQFPSTYLKEQHSNMVEYHVPLAPGGVADIFGQLESNKNYLEIQHFSVSQTTLDEVFINFAMEKFGTETIPLDDEDDDVSSMKDVEA